MNYLTKKGLDLKNLVLFLLEIIVLEQKIKLILAIFHVLNISYLNK